MTGFADHQAHGLTWRERAGPGPVLVALHGIGSEARCFDDLAAHLPGWRLIAWNAPGYGASAPLAMDWPLASDYAAALGHLVQRLGLTGFHLLGHSLGTLIGAAYAAAHPAGLRSLTLAACAQGGGVVRGTDLPAAQAARIADLTRDGARTFAEARAPRLIHAPQDHPDLVRRVAESMARVTLPGYAQAVRMLASGNLAADCARLGVPTAVAVGAMDIVTPPDQSRRAHGAIPSAMRRGLTEVPGAGHAIHLQAPAALAQVVAALAPPVAHSEKEPT